MSDENDDDLGLSLGLSNNQLHLNLMQHSQHPPDTTHLNLHNLFTSTDRNTTSCRRGIDVNQLPNTAGEFDDENGVSSPNSSTVSSQSGKRSKRGGEEERTTSCSIGGSDDEEGNGGGCGGVGDDMSSKKKLRLTKEQSLLLEDLFKDHNSLNTRQKQELAQRLSLSARQVEVWFQNRRARIKLKQTEVDCEQLKKCCENLTEENKRLQKEVQELRALKLSPQFYMQMNPPTTLTMCPSCQCVGVTPTGSSSSATATTASSKVLVTGHKGQPAIDRPVPISPWAALSILHHRPVDEPAPTSRS